MRSRPLARRRRLALAHGALVLAAMALGALFAFGSVLAIYLELEGFGGERDRGPRLGYLALLVLGLAASIGLPALLAWLLGRD